MKEAHVHFLVATRQRELGMPSVTYHIVEPDNFIRTLQEQQRELFCHYDITPTQVLIGAQDYQHMMGSPDIHQLMKFDAKYTILENGEMKIMGLKVNVVPWMRGILVMP